MTTYEQVEAVQESLAVDTTVADSLPPWFSEDLAWPYDAGFAFVDRIITDLDVAGLNQSYTLLPTTAEHIIHPGSYFTRQPPRAQSMSCSKRASASLQDWMRCSTSTWCSLASIARGHATC